MDKRAIVALESSWGYGEAYPNVTGRSPLPAFSSQLVRKWSIQLTDHQATNNWEITSSACGTRKSANTDQSKACNSSWLVDCSPLQHEQYLGNYAGIARGYIQALCHTSMRLKTSKHPKTPNWYRIVSYYANRSVCRIYYSNKVIILCNKPSIILE